MNKKGFVNLMFIIVIIALAGAAGYFALIKKPAEVLNDQISQVQDKTADWKVYRSEKYGFEFKYPSLLYIHDQPMGSDWEPPENNWVFIAQTSKPPIFGFEITCHFPSDFVEVIVQTEDVRTLGSTSINTQGGFLRVIEDNYIASGGAKVSDKMVNNLRIVKFDQSQVYGPKYIVFDGYAAYSISQERCGGGNVPLDKIAATFKSTAR